MKVRFTADHDVRVHRHRTIAYPSGWQGTIKRAWGEQAIALGRAVEVRDQGFGEDNARRPDDC